MPISAVYILDIKGSVLLFRDYRGEISSTQIDKFFPLFLENEENGTMTPILYCPESKCSYFYIRYSNIFFVAVTIKNLNACMCFLFLYKVVDIFKEYFKELEEESIRDNFVIIYELLDEIMDFGYPQTTESNILQEYITQESFKLIQQQAQIPKTVTAIVSWRKDNIYYRKNEIFIDVFEYVDLLITARGHTLRNDISGAVKIKSCLSGMPELRLGLNDRILFNSIGRKSKSVELDDIKFHQCVRLSRFGHDRTILFVPPDGNFDLMTYRVNTNSRPLILVDSYIEKYGSTRIEYTIKIRSQFKKKSFAKNVKVIVPAPSDSECPSFKTTIGHVVYHPQDNSIIWSIHSLQGGKEQVLKANIHLPSIRSYEEDTYPPIRVKFEIPYFTISGIQIRYIKIMERSGYEGLPWIRYITKAGDYLVRMK
ncbi:AP-1 complex subunit mu-1 [Intoshia linei]|uniref:AP-1 complex subunit mu-1 n=1 Tax=Intoshia linei TaxID=1819745 RepID=A0A177AW20_9BILA|nr:AP-1 complex subunit mu-1 [Intoshia linei]